MKQGELDNAKRRALNLFDAWNNITGFVTEHSSYYYELQGLIEDAVKCGAQAASGVYEALESERSAESIVAEEAACIRNLAARRSDIQYCEADQERKRLASTLHETRLKLQASEADAERLADGLRRTLHLLKGIGATGLIDWWSNRSVKSLHTVLASHDAMTTGGK